MSVSVASPPAVFEIAPVIVMLPAPAAALAVLMMTLVPALSAALISTTPIEAGLPTGSNTPALKEPALPAAMTTSDGSNNHVPA